MERDGDPYQPLYWSRIEAHTYPFNGMRQRTIRSHYNCQGQRPISSHETRPGWRPLYIHCNGPAQKTLSHHLMEGDGFPYVVVVIVQDRGPYTAITMVRD